jgi:hypothetical protein
MSVTVTRQQYFTAIAELGSMTRLYQAVNANPGNTVWIEFWSAPYITLGDPLALLTASVFGWNAAQMLALFTAAANVPIPPASAP